jgi:hypothetical protein
LGELWDFRINSYLPFGKKKSDYYHLHFKEFKGHYAYLDHKFEFAMKGVNAEVGWHLICKNIPLYVAAGPYYLEGQGNVAWGGEARLSLDVWNYMRLEGMTSYDNQFKWIAQGQISVIFPLGSKKENPAKRNRVCKRTTIAECAVQRVDRMEIIPIDINHHTFLAINPATGAPYFFWFVNNTSHSDGTFESPFPTLGQAQNASMPNDVIYIFPGDGTSTGINGGITLQPAQQLLGAGFNYSFPTQDGTVVIPAQASGRPLISNSAAILTNVVTAADANRIAGLNFDIAGAQGILASNIISGMVIDNNIFSGTVPGISTIDINGSGIISVTNNQINTSGFEAIRFVSINGDMNLFIDGNSVDSGSTYGVGFNFTSGSIQSCIVSNNLFSSSFGIFVGAGPMNININNNTIYQSNIGIQFDFNYFGSTMGTYFVSNNTITNISGAAINIDGGSTNIPTSTLTIQNNVLHNTPYGINGSGYNGDFFTFSQNQLSNISNTGISLPIFGASVCVDIQQNTFTSVSNNGISLPVTATSVFMDIEKNIFVSNTGYGVNVSNSTAGTTTCVRLLNNNSSSGYNFTASGGAILQLEPTSSNIGTVSTSGTTPVSAGTCSCSN